MTDTMQACIDVVPKNPANFNVDNVRVVKILGGGAHDSKVVKGVVIKRSTEGSIQDVTDAKVAVFAQGVLQCLRLWLAYWALSTADHVFDCRTLRSTPPRLSLSCS